MTTIELFANDEVLELIKSPTVSSGDLNAVELSVDFSAEWEGFAKVAVFFRDMDNLQQPLEQLLQDGICKVPGEVLKDHEPFYVGVRGAKDDSLKTTDIVKYSVIKGVPAIIKDVNIDVYQQILAAYANLETIRNEVDADAKQTAADRAEVKKMVDSVSGIDEQVAKVEKLSQQAQESATQAGTSATAADEAKAQAETAKAGAEMATGKTAEDRTAVNQAKTAVEEAQKAVRADRTAVEEVKQSVEQLGNAIPEATQSGVQAVNQAKQTAVNEITQTGTAHKTAVEGAGAKAVQDVENIKQTATEAVETAKTEAVQAVQTEGTAQTGKVSAEGKKQVQAVQQAAKEIVADREQIQTNKSDIALLKDIAIVEKASGKTIIIEDASNFPAESLNGTGKIIITGKNIIDTEKRKVFIPFSAETGTTFTLITNGQPSNGGNVKFIAVDGSEIWCPIDKGKKKVTFTLRKDAKGFYNILSPGESLKYCFSVGKNDKYEEYTEQILNAPISPEQLRNAHTNYPYTVLTSENEIAVEYVADTKLYIDKKLKQLVTANQSHTANLLSLMPMENQAAMIENDTNRILESEITP